jgi:2-polyprenyl-3-methyl-5-hydroxy-6-metoxy-1,4-benzoquinol methylase
VLEVGCGGGELARAIAGAGYEVVAIDPEAPPGPIFRALRLEEFADSTRFDAVVANRSLHHIAELARALDKIAGLLRPRGRLILTEHAWDRLDGPTAQWLLEQRAKIDPGSSHSLEKCLAEWREDHSGLHGSGAMREGLDLRFTELFFAWTPYLYGELEGLDLESEEGRQIESGAIQATGFRYVGERK